MIKVRCSGCSGEYDSRHMIIQSKDITYCRCCDYENSAKLDAKDNKDD